MKKTGIVGIILLLAALLLPLSAALAATDGFYNLIELHPAAWDGTDASIMSQPNTDYDYVYGDEKAITYSLPSSWGSFSFYGQSYDKITVDTNGNIWFAATDPANSFILASSGRGPVIAAWNNDLSSNYYVGAFIQHKNNPERLVIEWQAETYRDQGAYRPNNFEVVIFQNGIIRIDYKSSWASDSADFGSGISKGDGTNSLSISSNYGPAASLMGRTFLFAPGSNPNLVVMKNDIGTGTVTSVPAGISCGTVCTGTYAPGSSVSLNAVPDSGSVFTGWGGACSGTGACSVTLDGYKTVSATFTPMSPPVVSITSPTNGSVSNNPVLGYTSSPGTVVVKVDGTIVNKGNGQSLNPLSNGSHVVRVEVTNLAGYTGFAENTFSVDSLPPVVTTVAPTAGAQNVPINSVMAISFNEAINTASLAVDSIVLTYSAGQVPGAISSSLDAKALIFTPAGHLGYNQTYTVTLKAGLQDIVGNAIGADYVYSFTTQSDNADLVGLWHMDNDWSDSSGKGNNGTTSGASFSTEKIAGSASGNFNGTSSYVSIPDADMLSPQSNGNMTLSAWVYLRSYPIAAAPIIAKGTSGSYEYGLYVYNDGTAGLTLWQPNGTPHIAVQGGKVPLNKWCFVAATYDLNGIKKAIVYVDGAEVSSGAYVAGSSVNGTSPLQLGRRPDNADNQYINALIDEAAIYKNTLTADEILIRYNYSPKVTVTSPGQTVYYKPGNTGTSTVTVTHPVGADSLTCTASGAASGTLSLPIAPPQTQVTQDFSFQVAADSLPNSTATVVCSSAVITTGYVGSSTINLVIVDGSVPFVVSSSIADNAQNVSATTSVTISFSEAMAQASVNSSSVTLITNDGTNQQIPVTVTFSSDLKSITITPTVALLGNSPYLLTISTAVTDTVGNHLAQDYVVHFTTTPTIALSISGQGSSSSPYVVAPGRYSTVSINNSYVVCNGWMVADTITLASSSVLSHSGATTSTTYNLEITATSVNIDDTSKIDVTGMGYLGGGAGDNGLTGFGRTIGNTFGPQQSLFGPGGNYGGLGGPTATNINPLYGSLQFPVDLGSGGSTYNNTDYPLYISNYPAGNGGGRVKLTSQVLTLNGKILADGGSVGLYIQNASGGSGGSVLLRVGDLLGSGTVSASGGTPDAFYSQTGGSAGGGGGGRIAIYYDTNDLPSNNVIVSGGYVNANNTMNGNAGTIYLSPKLMPLAVALAGSGTGTIQSSPAGISCGTNGTACSSQFATGSSVTLSAFPDANSTFVGWSGLCSGIVNRNCTVPLSAAITITATFGKIPPPTIVSPSGSINTKRPFLYYSLSDGTTAVTVSVDGVVVNKLSGQTLGPLSEGSHVVRVEAVNVPGSSAYSISNFIIDTTPPVLTINPVVTPTTSVLQTLSGTIDIGSTVDIVGITGASVGPVSYPSAGTWMCAVSNLALGDNKFTITATDVANNSSRALVTIVKNLPTITITKSGNGTGIVTSSPNGIACGGVCSTEFANGTSVTLTAVPDPGSIFIGWSGACGGTGTCTVTLNASASITSTFNLLPPTADFTMTPTTGVAPIIINFSDLSHYANTWLWNFGDGSISTQQNPSHLYISPGSYSVSLIVTNSVGAVMTTKTNILSFMTCSTPPVRILGAQTYMTLQDAFNAASDGAIIQSVAQNFVENVTNTNPNNFTLSGGYACDFSSTTGKTNLKGTLSINDGTLTIEDVDISD
jgi:PKD repeat protein